MKAEARTCQNMLISSIIEPKKDMYFETERSAKLRPGTAYSPLPDPKLCLDHRAKNSRELVCWSKSWSHTVSERRKSGTWNCSAYACSGTCLGIYVGLEVELFVLQTHNRFDCITMVFVRCCITCGKVFELCEQMVCQYLQSECIFWLIKIKQWRVWRSMSPAAHR
jgi:hypothetical protein